MIGLVVSLLAVAGALSQTTEDDCEVSGVHLTLGDYFSLDSQELVSPKDDSHMLTIGLVTTCRMAPVIRFFLCPTSDSDKEVQNCDLLPSESESAALTIQGVEYRRTAHFYFVNQEMLSHSGKWKIKGFGDWREWPQSVGNQIQTKLSMVVYGDLDISTISGNQTLSYLEKTEGKTSFHQLIVHLGDFAYNIEDDGGMKGDQFFEGMSSITSKVPYIAVRGNHDSYGHGYLFGYRFRMPGKKQTRWPNVFYDFIYEGVYFLVADWNYLLKLYPQDTKEVLEWMIERLSLATVRRDLKWKILLSHKPIYCNDFQYTSDCTVNYYRLKAFDDLLHKYGIDLVFNAHVHEYARFHPMSNFVVWNSSQTSMSYDTDPYLQIIAGHGGSPGGDPDNLEDYMTPFVAMAEVNKPCLLEVNVSVEETTGMAIDTEDSTTRVVIDSWLRMKKAKSHRNIALILTLVVLLIIACLFLMPGAISLYRSWRQENEEEKRLRGMPILYITPDRADNYINVELDTLRAPSPVSNRNFKSQGMLKPTWKPKIVLHPTD